MTLKRQRLLVPLEYYLHYRGDNELPTRDIYLNAVDLLYRVSCLFDDIGIYQVTMTSGWRPEEYNRRKGGAERSPHVKGKAIDIDDDDNKTIGKKIMDSPALLKKYGLWLEHIEHTKTWVHLDTHERWAREVQVFRP